MSHTPRHAATPIGATGATAGRRAQARLSRPAVAAVCAGLCSVPSPVLAATPVAGADGVSYASFALGCMAGAVVTGAASVLVAAHERRTPVVGAHVAGGVTSDQLNGKAVAEVWVDDDPVSYASWRESLSGEHASTDYADVAERYVRSQRLARRVATSAGSVRETLAERLGETQRVVASMASVREALSARLGETFMEDLPVIERAAVGGQTGRRAPVTDVAGGMRAAAGAGAIGASSQQLAAGMAGVALRPEAAGMAPQPEAVPVSHGMAPFSGALWDTSGVVTNSLDASVPAPAFVRHAAGEDAPAHAPATDGAVVAGASGSAEPQHDSSPAARAEAARRAAYISHKIAQVDEGAFPAHRTAAELDVTDEFDRALAAMDDRFAAARPAPMGVAATSATPVAAMVPMLNIVAADGVAKAGEPASVAARPLSRQGVTPAVIPEVAPVQVAPGLVATLVPEVAPESVASPAVGGTSGAARFADAVGGTDTLDDPSGLEDDTSFLAFRVPAGHPEVVDEKTYVDYLLDEELGVHSSGAARRSYLRVVEGGTGSLDASKVSTARLASARLAAGGKTGAMRRAGADWHAGGAGTGAGGAAGVGDVVAPLPVRPGIGRHFTSLPAVASM